jgi:FG-GAP repeat
MAVHALYSVEALLLAGPGTVAGDWFGGSIAMSATTIVVGAPALYTSRAGRVYVFTKKATGWQQSAELVGPGTKGGDGFGSSVGIAGNTIVIGTQEPAPAAGQAYVFTKTSAGWRLSAQLTGSDARAGDYVGSVAISGGTIVVGAFGHDRGTGTVHVFNKFSNGWQQSAELVGSGTNPGDWFGDALAFEGNDLVVGASGNTPVSGKAYVFARR